MCGIARQHHSPNAVGLGYALVNIVKGLVGNLIGTAFFMDTGHAGLHALVRKYVFVFFFKPGREHDAPESIGNLQ